MRKTALIVLMAGFLPAVFSADNDTIVGSGKLATKEVKVTDFTAVDVGSAFKVKITRADAFSVSVTADDNVVEFVKVTKKDATLEISLDTGKNRSFQNATFTATIAMPALEAVNLSGATQATVTGFKSNQGFKAKLSGASSLDGTLDAGKLEMEAAGASTVTLKGSAKEAMLAAVGASQLKLSDFAVVSAAINLSGASSMSVNAKDKLDYVLSGASSLEFHGNPAIGKSETSGVSSAKRK